MLPEIQILTPELANQIAAGEVVERPASVVKELLENCLDAGANQIYIDLEKAGIGLIKIRDDGHGIAKQQLALALSRHATSKIKSLAELNSISSLGFRGEALASMSSVAKLILCSKTADSEHAWQVRVEGREQKPIIEPAAHPQGTTVSVRDLFYNTPARRKFLRSEKTELMHIEEVVKRIALSRFDVGFVLRQQQKEFINVKAIQDPNEYAQRITKILGKAFMDSAYSISAEIAGIKLWGWLANPEYARSQTDQQYFFVNGRVIRDRLINHAIRQAYADSLYEGRHPSYVLYLEIDPSEVDVNVHPTKHEVRFRENRLVHDFILQKIQQALFPEDSALETEPVNIANPERQPEYKPQQQFNYNFQASNKPNRNAIQDEIRLYKTLRSVSQDLSTPAETQAAHKPQLQPRRNLLSCYDQFILFEEAGELHLLDQQAARRQIAYASLCRAMQGKELVTQPLLIPTQIKLSQAQLQCLEKMPSFLQQIGIEYNLIAEQTILVRQLPAVLKDVAVEQLFNKLFDFYAKNEHKSSNNQFLLELVASFCQHAEFAIKAKLNPKELEHFLTELQQSEDYLDSSTLKRAIVRIEPKILEDLLT